MYGAYNLYHFFLHCRSKLAPNPILSMIFYVILYALVSAVGGFRRSVVSHLAVGNEVTRSSLFLAEARHHSGHLWLVRLLLSVLTRLGCDYWLGSTKRWHFAVNALQFFVT